MFGAGLPNTASGRLPRAVIIGAAIDPAPETSTKRLNHILYNQRCPLFSCSYQGKIHHVEDK